MTNQGLFDTHCHLLDKNYHLTPDEIIATARKSGVKRMVNVCVDLDEAEEIIKLATIHKEDGVFGTVGVHPSNCDKNLKTENDLKKLEFCARNNNVVAIGECGLDFFREKNVKKRKLQQEVFITQIKIAQAVHKPLIVHCRDAFDVCYNILKKYTKKSVNPVGVMHCFTGTLETAIKFIELGFMISFAGNITFKNALDLQNVCSQVSLSNIVIETDSPYLSPEPYRGKLNYPSNLKIIAQKISQLKQIYEEELIKITENNAGTLFQI